MINADLFSACATIDSLRTEVAELIELASASEADLTEEARRG